MAKDKVVDSLLADLRHLAERLDSEWNGLQLCLAYQTESSFDSHSWTFSICADYLDGISELKALLLVRQELQKDLGGRAASMIERVIILRDWDEDKVEIMERLDSAQDGYRLTGQNIFGRIITKAHIFVLHKPALQSTSDHTIRF